MSEPGWYPDPGGSGQFRFWDGTSWSATTSPTPSGSGAPPDPSPGRGRSRAGIVLLLVTVLVVVAGVAIVVLRPWNQPTDITDNPPTPTVTGGDDGPISANPSDSPSPSDLASSGPPTTCTPGSPYERTSTSDDGLLRGGGLTIPVVDAPDWDPPRIGGTPFGWDVASQETWVTPNWYNLVSVGALLKEAGYETPEQAAKLVFSCSVTGSWYTERTGVTMLVDEAVTIDGHEAYEISASVLESVNGHPEITGDVVDVVVVDTGDPDRLGVYLSTATIDDQPILDVCATTRAGLRVA